jgi:Holliday junction resolvase RusA-like endonuclease
MKLEFSLRGAQPSTLTKQRSPWRKAIASCVAERFPSAPYSPPDGTRFTVDATFYLVEQRLFLAPNWPDPPDLDNLLKPVLDTLFTSKGVLGLTGTLVAANDTNVTEVTARKIKASSHEQEGADFTVTWDE